jgi:hypothetical protein
VCPQLAGGLIHPIPLDPYVQLLVFLATDESLISCDKDKQNRFISKFESTCFVFLPFDFPEFLCVKGRLA